MLRSDCNLLAILKMRARRKERNTVMPLTLTVISTKLTITMKASKQLNRSAKYLPGATVGGGGGSGDSGGGGGNGGVSDGARKWWRKD